MSKLIDLGAVSEETLGTKYHSVDEDGKENCDAPNSTLFYRLSAINGVVDKPACPLYQQ